MSKSSHLGIIILAAGKGERMKSSLPKVLHRVGGKPMILHVVETAQTLKPDKVVIIVGRGKEWIIEILKDEDIIFVEQVEQLGTGHAVLQAKEQFVDFEGTILVLSGDVPLISQITLDKLLQKHYVSHATATLLSTFFENPTGYGRIVRNHNGALDRIVEEKDCDDDLKSIREINAGIYAFDAQPLFQCLTKVGCDNLQKEYYLPDVIPIMKRLGHLVAIQLTQDTWEVAGVNTREQLNEINRNYNKSYEQK